MRLYPPVWVIEREAVEDVDVGGRTIRKGTAVVMSQWIVQRDARWFEDPEEFRPERWSRGHATRWPHFAYFPFGGGPRVCIGAGFARTEAILLLAIIAQRFHLELVPDQKVVPQPTITLRPRNGIQIRLHRR
jgi:cytochrome P450